MTNYRADRLDAPAPIGAIKYRQEIVDLIAESKETGEEIRIWTVTQSGSLGAFIITPQSELVAPELLVPTPGQLCSGPGFYEITKTWTEYGFEDGSYTKYGDPAEGYDKSELLGSFNIESSADACHYAFTSPHAAIKYSIELENDERYQRSVKEWHSICDTMFEEIERGYGYDSSDDMGDY